MYVLQTSDEWDEIFKIHRTKVGSLSIFFGIPKKNGFAGMPATDGHSLDSCAGLALVRPIGTPNGFKSSRWTAVW
jgi:hypothetical protein